MTDELQTETNDSGITLDNDHIESEETTEVEETAEGGAELAPAQEEEPAKIDDGVQKAINKQHAKYREEERKRIQVEKEAAELKERLEKLEAAQGEVVVPPMPDQWDDDYETKMQARDEAIMRKAQQDAKSNLAVEQQTAAQEAAAQAEQERQNNLVKGFNSRITQLGLDASEIGAAVDTVVSYGIDGALGEFILQQEDGPLITKYLAANPLKLDDLRNMTPINAALKISSEIRQAASSLKPQATAAPDPIEPLAGRGAGDKASPFIAGATFD
jgi:hypothetical protein